MTTATFCCFSSGEKSEIHFSHPWVPTGMGCRTCLDTRIRGCSGPWCKMAQYSPLTPRGLDTSIYWAPPRGLPGPPAGETPGRSSRDCGQGGRRKGPCATSADGPYRQAPPRRSRQRWCNASSRVLQKYSAECAITDVPVSPFAPSTQRPPPLRPSPHLVHGHGLCA